MKKISASSLQATRTGKSPRNSARVRGRRQSAAADAATGKPVNQVARETEESFRAMVEQSPFSTIVFSPSGDVTQVNDAHLRLWGVTRELAMQFKVFKDAQLEALGLWPFFRRAFAGEQLSVPPLEYDLQAALGAGHKKIVQADFYPLRDTQGKVTSVILVHQDVTERVQAEKALRSAEERLRLALEVTGAGTWEVDLRNGQVVVDAKTRASLGYSPEEIPKTVEAWTAIRHPEDQERAEAAFQGLLRGETALFRIEQRTRKKDGTWTWSESRGCVAERNAEGVPVRVIGTHVSIDERKQAETALRESESKFRAVFESAHDAILLLDHQVLLACNPHALTIFGCAAVDLVGHSPPELSPAIQPDGRPSVEKARELMELAFQGNPQFFEWQHRRKDGTLFDTEVSLTRVESAGGVCLQAIVRDVSERKRANGALRRSEANLQAIMANTSDIIASCDCERRLVAYNQACSEAFRRLFGVEVHPGFRPLDLFPEAMRADWTARGARALAGESFTVEFELPSPDTGRQVFETSYHPIRHNDKVVGFLTTTRNVTQRRGAEEALRESESRLRAITDSAQDAIILLNSKGVITFWNPAAASILGHVSEEAVGRNLHDLVAPSRYLEAYHAALSEFVRTGRGNAVGKTVELTARRKDGKEITISLSLSAILLGGEWHAVGILRDITESKYAELVIRRLSELGRNLSSASDAAAAAQAVAEVADDLLGWDACFLKLRSADQTDATYVLSVDLVDGKRQSIGSSVGREVTSIERKVMDHGPQLILRDDPEQEGHFVMFGDASRPAASLMFVPLRHRGQYLGLFAIHSYRRHAYTQASLELLQVLADYVAGALERIRAEEAFRDSEDRYGRLVNSMKDILYSISVDGKVQYIGPQVRAYGFLESEMVGQDFLPFIFPEDRSAVLGDFQRTASTGEETQSTFRLATKKGEVFWFEEIGRAVRNQAGAIVAVTGMLRDVTERKKAEAAQAESELRFSELFERSPDAVFVEDASGTILDANPAACRLHGLSRAQLVGKNVLETVSPDARTTVAAEFPKWMTGELTQAEGTSLTATGKAVPVEIRGALIHYGDQPALLLHVRDIRERKEAESRIRQQAALLEASHDAILVWDVENGIQLMNRAAQELTGLDLTQASSQPLSAVLRLRSEVALEVAIQEVTTKGDWNGELTLLTAAEKQRVVASRWTLLPHPEGRPASVLITCNDITEKKQLEQQYLRAQRLESVGTLASGVAHDLNNILTPVLMGVELLGMQSQDEETHGILNMMKESTRRGADTVKQLLTFARGTEAQKGPVQPRHLLKEIARLLQQTFPKNIQIYTDCAEEPVTLLADLSQLHQVLMNLCVNARDAMPDGGVLYVRLENRTLDEAGAKVHPKARPQSYVVFKITDSGTGIPPEILDRIFDPFFTTKPQGKGTGLGLATVLGIVEDHGGFVLVDSKTGKGTTFQVFLPASASIADGLAEIETPALPRGRDELILVVDDEAAILHLASEILRHGGYLTLTASNASEAVHLYERNHDRIRVVLTDIMMPFGDGRQLITMLHEQNPKLPIIGMSGLATKEFQRETLLRGARAFIRKPFTAEELLRLLADLARPSAPSLAG